jgi:hypothetical protein
MNKQLILVLSGKKQSGKNTLANFIIGSYLVYTNQIYKFDITEKGLLKIPFSHDILIPITKQLDMSIIVPEGDFNNCGFEGIKLYSFAEPLKRFCMEVFGLTCEQCYGSDEDKNTFTSCKWNNISNDIKNKHGYINGLMRARKVMQIFGTDMVRTMLDDAWPIATYRKIKKEKMELAIVTDARFPNEINLGKECGVVSIRLMRDICKKDYHPSETALDDYKEFDKVFDNRTTTIEEQNKMAKPFIDFLLRNIE